MTTLLEASPANATPKMVEFRDGVSQPTTTACSYPSSNKARKTVDRMIDVFPSSQQPQVRTQLAASLRGIVAQLLLKKAGGKGRIAVNEILIRPTEQVG